MVLTARAVFNWQKLWLMRNLLPVFADELKRMEGTKENLENHGQIDEYKWKGSKSQATELIYALVKLKCVSVGDRDADLRDMAAFFRERLGLNIDNIYDVALHNRKRKKEKVPFLNAMLGVYLTPAS